MRVLVLGYAFSDHKGGGEAMAGAALVRALGESGVDVTAVTPEFSVEAPFPKSIRVVQVRSDVRSGHTGLNKARIVAAARRLVAQERFDVVHSVSQFTSWPIFARPFVVTGCYRPHAVAAPPAGQARGRVSAAARSLLVAPRAEVASRAFEIARSAYEERFRGRDLAWTLRNADHRIVRQSAGLPHFRRYGPTTYIPVGADVDFFTPGPDPKVPGLVAYAGHLQAYKHPVNLVEAIALLRDEGLPARVAMTGRGPMEAEIRLAARRLGIEDRVELLGHVPREALRAHLQRASVFCLPSQDEPGGMANVEAMACGTPVVCARTIVAALDYVEEGVNGSLATDNSPRALADKLRPFLADASFARRAGAAARRTAERFSWREIARRHVSVYQSL